MSAMVRRWIIRLPFLLALAFVVGVWVTSYFGAFTYFTHFGSRYWQFGGAQGLGYVSEDPKESSFSDHFDFERGHNAAQWFGGHPTLGFSIESGSEIGIHNLGGGDTLGVVYPFWLPTLLLLALNWFVWRKTRARPVGGAFPVDVTAKTNDQAI